MKARGVAFVFLWCAIALLGLLRPAHAQFTNLVLSTNFSVAGAFVGAGTNSAELTNFISMFGNPNLAGATNEGDAFTSTFANSGQATNGAAAYGESGLNMLVVSPQLIHLTGHTLVSNSMQAGYVGVAGAVAGSGYILSMEAPTNTPFTMELRLDAPVPPGFVGIDTNTLSGTFFSPSFAASLIDFNTFTEHVVGELANVTSWNTSLSNAAPLAQYYVTNGVFDSAAALSLFLLDSVLLETVHYTNAPGLASTNVFSVDYTFKLSLTPEVKIGTALTNFTFGWPTNHGAYVIETTLTPADPGSWVVTNIAPVLSNGNYVIVLPFDGEGRYFRLRK